MRFSLQERESPIYRVLWSDYVGLSVRGGLEWWSGVWIGSRRLTQLSCLQPGARSSDQPTLLGNIKEGQTRAAA
jgi:hypothetical protein